MKQRMNSGPRTPSRAERLFLGVVFVLVSAIPSAAQTAISAGGVVESTSGGFKFPDGSVQTTAAAPGTAPVGDTGQQICYDPTGVTTDEVPCAMTGQDGELQRGVDWPAPRFTNNLDGTVTDNLTGLIWLQDANCASLFAPMDFEDAIAGASSLSQGYCGLVDGSVAGDWRLPNIKELLSLVDYGESAPPLPSGHPFTNVQGYYWSSTTIVEHADFARLVNMGLTYDLVVAGLKNLSSFYLWPVRGGQ